ncbi:hypothetical protein H8L32_17985 [Undibacterium sp. CY18W]|uniref:Uncharacterized protein n=1 Tax=Undibacterium hunanense TaxID=2762292 RepID=A0ABR6ZU44_9BURK|nr:hypothetical protein [Undibacterium hunanense]MBC3919386.1 hypothetical protein [Undibacterium hunanense]
MWAKSLAAALLGLPLSVAIVGLLALFGPGDVKTRTLPLLLLVFLVWIASMCSAFLFKTGLRAWLWMGAATLLGFTAIHLLKAMGLAMFLTTMVKPA